MPDAPSIQQIQQIIRQLQGERRMLGDLPPATLEKIARSLLKFSDGTANNALLQKVIADFQSRLSDARSFTQPDQMRTLLSDLGNQFALPQIADRVYKTLGIAQRIADGAGIFLSQNNPGVVAEYPALEFKRLMARLVPRGSTEKADDPDWFERWSTAGDAAADDDFTDADSGRLVALKSSDIWNQLGSSDNFPDGTDLSFAPFAWESGWSTVNVDRDETESLGLLDPGEEATPAKIDYANLFPNFEEAA